MTTTKNKNELLRDFINDALESLNTPTVLLQKLNDWSERTNKDNPCFSVELQSDEPQNAETEGGGVSQHRRKATYAVLLSYKSDSSTDRNALKVKAAQVEANFWRAANNGGLIGLTGSRPFYEFTISSVVVYRVKITGGTVQNIYFADDDNGRVGYMLAEGELYYTMQIT